MADVEFRNAWRRNDPGLFRDAKAQARQRRRGYPQKSLLPAV